MKARQPVVFKHPERFDGFTNAFGIVNLNDVRLFTTDGTNPFFNTGIYTPLDFIDIGSAVRWRWKSLDDVERITAVVFKSSGVATTVSASRTSELLSPLTLNVERWVYQFDGKISLFAVGENGDSLKFRLESA